MPCSWPEAHCLHGWAEVEQTKHQNENMKPGMNNQNGYDIFC